MGHRFQLGGCLLTIWLSALLAGPVTAQGRRANWAQQEHRPPRATQRSQERPQPRQQTKNAERGAQQERRQSGGAGNPQQNGGNRPPAFVPRPNANSNPNRPPSSYIPPQPQRKFNDLSPQEKQRVIDNYNRLNRMPPAQRQEMQQRVETWNRLTPEQKTHIRNDVLPRWRQMAQDRRQAIRQRLRVLQNMPEFARNQRLNDPEFTRGMSEEDKATLRDLSHLHVGGAPDPPGE